MVVQTALLGPRVYVVLVSVACFPVGNFCQRLCFETTNAHDERRVYTSEISDNVLNDSGQLVNLSIRLFKKILCLPG